MEKLRNTLFFITGMVGILMQSFGIYTILILVGIITHTWIAEIIIGVVLSLIDYWKFRYFRSEDYLFKFGGFHKKDNLEEYTDKEDAKVISFDR